MEGYNLGFRFEQLGGGDMMTFTKKKYRRKNNLLDGLVG